MRITSNHVISVIDRDGVITITDGNTGNLIMKSYPTEGKNIHAEAWRLMNLAFKWNKRL